MFALPEQKRVARVKQGVRPDLIAFTPDGALAYVTNRDSREVFVMDAPQAPQHPQNPRGQRPPRRAGGSARSRELKAEDPPSRP